MEKNTTNMLRSKAILNFALFSIPKGGRNGTFHLSSFKSATLIKNDSLPSEESKAKNCLNTPYTEQVMSI